MQVSNLFAVVLAGVMFAVPVVHANETAPAEATGESAMVSNTEADDRMVCEYEKPIGSHMKKRICKTVADRNRDREDARDAMNTRPTCGNCTGD